MKGLAKCNIAEFARCSWRSIVRGWGIRPSISTIIWSSVQLKGNLLCGGANILVIVGTCELI